MLNESGHTIAYSVNLEGILQESVSNLDWKGPVQVIWCNIFQIVQFELNLQYRHMWRLQNCFGKLVLLFDCRHAEHCFPNTE